MSHKNLDVWRDSIELVLKIYRLTAKYPVEEKFGLVSQIRKVAVSISSNIAEGASRISGKEKKRFYEIVRSSLVELDTQLVISKALKFISEKDIIELDELINKIFAQLTVMRKRVKIK